jgi:hypothetical protein
MTTRTTRDEIGLSAFTSLIRNILAAGLLIIVAWFVIVHLKYGWAGYGKFSFWLALGVYVVSMVVHLICTIWGMLG